AARAWLQRLSPAGVRPGRSGGRLAASRAWFHRMRPGAAHPERHRGRLAAARAWFHRLRPAAERPGFHAEQPSTALPASTGEQPSTARPWFLGLRLAAPLAVALGLATVVLLREPADGVRVKGGPFVSLVRQRDGAVDAPVRPGDVVTLSVHAAPHRYALVLVTDVSGAVSPLWPARGDRSGDPATLSATPTFVVTPGSFTLDAYFSDAPLSLRNVRDAVASAASACVARRLPPDCQPPSTVEGAARHHRLSVSVSSEP
ncbi:hypothetical protein ACLESD_32460, partial [Pyxidicoccus sp. 3LFB2]